MVLTLALGCVAAVRLVLLARVYACESLQMDFSAFYTAGESLNQGLSPYRTYLDQWPPVWDGVGKYTNSRFLYPPLAAAFFQPLALMPYSWAKVIWTGFCLVSVAAALVLAVKPLPMPTRLRSVAAWLIVFFYYPLLTLLEKGQIDALTLLLVAPTIPLIVRRERELGVGFLLSVASLFKLHLVYVVPFLALGKRWRVLLGYGIGGLCVLLASSATVKGRSLLVSYVSVELPRIASYGEAGSPAMLLEESLLTRARESAALGFTVKGGRYWKIASFNFVSNATLATNAYNVAARFRLGIDLPTISLVLLGVLAAALATWRWFLAQPAYWEGTHREQVYWYVVIIMVLLAAPRTWVMNLVWLLPLPLVMVQIDWNLRNRRERVALTAAMLALALIAVPDGGTATAHAPVLGRLVLHKYVAGQLILLVALLTLLVDTSSTRSVWQRLQTSLRGSVAMPDVGMRVGAAIVHKASRRPTGGTEMIL